MEITRKKNEIQDQQAPVSDAGEQNAYQLTKNYMKLHHRIQRILEQFEIYRDWYSKEVGYNSRKA